MAHDHDIDNKLLFSAPEMVRDLLRGYVPQEWVKSADFTSLRRDVGPTRSKRCCRRHRSGWLNRRLRHRLPAADTGVRVGISVGIKHYTAGA